MKFNHVGNHEKGLWQLDPYESVGPKVQRVRVDYRKHTTKKNNAKGADMAEEESHLAELFDIVLSDFLFLSLVFFLVH